MSQIEVDFDDLCFALESSLACYINLQTGLVISLPKHHFEDLAGLFDEVRSQVEADKKKFAELEPFPSDIAFSIMEEFAEQLNENEACKKHLLSALSKGSPFRRFKDALNYDLDLRKQWFKFKEDKMEYWAAWWIRKNSIDVKIVRKNRNRT